MKTDEILMTIVAAKLLGLFKNDKPKSIRSMPFIPFSTPYYSSGCKRSKVQNCHNSFEYIDSSEENLDNPIEEYDEHHSYVDDQNGDQTRYHYDNFESNSHSTQYSHQPNSVVDSYQISSYQDDHIGDDHSGGQSLGFVNDHQQQTQDYKLESDLEQMSSNTRKNYNKLGPKLSRKKSKKKISKRTKKKLKKNKKKKISKKTPNVSDEKTNSTIDSVNFEPNGSEKYYSEISSYRFNNFGTINDSNKLIEGQKTGAFNNQLDSNSSQIAISPLIDGPNKIEFFNSINEAVKKNNSNRPEILSEHEMLENSESKVIEKIPKKLHKYWNQFLSGNGHQKNSSEKYPKNGAKITPTEIVLESQYRKMNVQKITEPSTNPKQWPKLLHNQIGSSAFQMNPSGNFIYPNDPLNRLNIPVASKPLPSGMFQIEESDVPHILEEQHIVYPLQMDPLWNTPMNQMNQK
ncbi:hypothetical protein QR98_0017090 [Sarcoptes scabiei]|uniref:Uncharacterized protein n=1 Tax=Sarcoptes scabiei TaxID=52283 RepID=A0A131ZXQ3_SARSC|nr:hypothetical protein QR98_0017090 [Sarcoptes scabiei]